VATTSTPIDRPQGSALNGTNQSPKVIGGVRFQDGIEVIEVPANRAA
jgi:hypothetical protein